MVGKVKNSEVRSVRIFVTVRSVVFFKVKSVFFVIRVAALPIQKVGEQTEKRDVKKTKETAGLAIKNVPFSR